MTQPISIVWFRRDLRCADNPALTEAKARGAILPIFILDENGPPSAGFGAAATWWLHHSLASLDTSLQHHLNFYRGDPLAIIRKLAADHKVSAVFVNRGFDPWHDDVDKRVAQELAANDVEMTINNASLLWDPEDIAKADGSPYKVFTAFYHHLLNREHELGEPLTAPTHLHLIKDPGSLSLDNLDLLPRIKWYASLEKSWHIGEKAARDRLHQFIANDLDRYAAKRDFPSAHAISRLSPHLHFGEISALTVWQSVSQKSHPFLRELVWREFAHYLLHHFPMLPEKNLIAKFDKFPWHHNKRLLTAWQNGQTGYPFVDAGMRELWQTGFMHNRVRMVVASFLIKNLLIDWRHGAAWFLDCLVDADLANNSTNWQWVAGSGVDASPFFRIFNPITQGEKFDADGDYTLRYVPELRALPKKYLFKPWSAPDDVLKKAHIVIGTTYPKPIVDLVYSRERALAAFRTLS